MDNFYLMIKGTYYKLADQQAATKARSGFGADKRFSATMAENRSMTINPAAVAYWSIFNSAEDLRSNGEPASSSTAT